MKHSLYRDLQSDTDQIAMLVGLHVLFYYDQRNGDKSGPRNLFPVDRSFTVFPVAGCNGIALVSGKHHIPDSQLHASPVLDTRHAVGRSRLNLPANGAYAGAWIPKYSDARQYLKVLQKFCKILRRSLIIFVIFRDEKVSCVYINTNTTPCSPPPWSSG